MLEVHNLDQSPMMLILKKGLKVGPFYFSLSKRFLYDLTKMFTHVDKYNTKEGMLEKRKEKKSKIGLRRDNLTPQPTKQKNGRCL